MPDVQEVFRMSTQKVRPDRGFTQRQEFRQRRAMRNRKIGAYVVVAAIVAVSGIAFVATREGDPGTGQPAAPEDPTDAPAPTATTHSFLDLTSGERSPVGIDLGGARLLEVSPNGEAVAYSTCCENDAIFVANLDGSGVQTISPDELDGYGPTWIDDERILFQGRPERTDRVGDLYVADLTTGEVTMVTDLPDVRNLAWVVVSDVSPDGSTVLYHLPRGRDSTKYDLWTAPLAGGEPTLVREDAGYGQYTADGRIVFLEHAEPFQSDAIWVMDGDGSNARSIVGKPGDVYTWPRVSPDGTQVAFSHDGEVEIVAIDGGSDGGGDAGSGGQKTGEFTAEPAWFGNDKLIV